MVSTDVDTTYIQQPGIAPLATGGIVSGPGNQGSANTAHMIGQSGTAGTFLGSPRQMGFGQTGSKPT
jgi:hypothetical protein